jgi:TRAP-type C4-dicarboxylate transport system substrate-binding protein
MMKKGLQKTMMGFFLIIILAAFACVPAFAAEEVIALRYSSPFMPNEPPDLQAKHALDLIEKRTNGRVKFERFIAGALGGPLEQLELVSSGAADLIPLHLDQYAQQLPLYQIPPTEQRVSIAQGLANVTALTKEIPETKVLFEAEEKRNNIKALYFHAQGATGVTARFSPNSLADLKGKKVNVVAGYHRKVFKELGWIPVNVQIPELYEALSRGVIDAIWMTTAAIVPLKWYEIAKTQLVLGQNAMNNVPLTFNLDTWNRLPGDIQQVITESARETAQWSVQLNEELLKMTYAKLEEEGVRIVKISDEESDTLFKVLLKQNKDNCLNIAKAAGVEKDALVIFKYWDEMKWGKWKK